MIQSKKMIEEVKWLLSTPTTQRDVVRRYDVTVKPPEGDYLVHAKNTVVTRKWRLWPFRTCFLAIDYEVDEEQHPHGLPYAGKGENSWDCGDDGIFGGWLPWKLGDPDLGTYLLNQVLDERRKHGGLLDWSGERKLSELYKWAAEHKDQLSEANENWINNELARLLSAPFNRFNEAFQSLGRSSFLFGKAIVKGCVDGLMQEDEDCQS